MIAFALCLLALADASFSGFRAHAGRDGRISKRAAKAMAASTGLVAGVIVLSAFALFFLGAVALGLTTRAELDEAGSRMLVAYAVYATAVTVGFAGYFSPWLEVRSLSTMLVLGPGTFVRPLVVVGGAVAAAVGSSWFVIVGAVVAAVVMLAIEPALWRWFDARQETTMVPYVAARRRNGRSR